MKILIIDNYDSFTYNLFQYVAEVSQTIPEVFLNTSITVEEIKKKQPTAIIISPGPGTATDKRDFGVSGEILEKVTIPTLGVCLGHQGIAAIAGAKITTAKEIMHGRKSAIFHSGADLFANIPQGFLAVRYHSLVINARTLPDQYAIIAWTKDKTIMGIAHKTKPLWGVQFHPESIGTEYGKQLLLHFIERSQRYAKKI